MKKCFAVWMAAVDAAIAAKYGLDSNDLPDCDYYSWWASGMSAAAAAKKALKNAEF